jgi:radical SAM protein with 4Fe4S-binding SPASM domain
MNRWFASLKTLISREHVIIFDKIDFRYHHLSAKRLKTWVLTELAYFFKSPHILTFPTHMQIEPSSICNLRCPLCHVVTDNKPKGLLRFEDFKNIMDEIGDSLFFLHFWGWGEPFLNPEIYSMIRYAKNKGVQIISSTNGHFFDNEENIDRLIESGLDVLIFALDGLDRDTYEKYRRKGDFDRVISNLRRLVQRKNEKGTSLPRINLRMLVTKDNEDQVERMKHFAAEVGVDIFSLKSLGCFDNEKVWQTILPNEHAYRRYRYNKGGHPIRIDNPCKKPWNHPVIYRDGSVVLCDYYTGEEFNLGNAFAGDSHGFGRIWFGNEYRLFRKRFVKKERSGIRCDNCSLNYADVDRCVPIAFVMKEKGSGTFHQEPI